MSALSNNNDNNLILYDPGNKITSIDIALAETPQPSKPLATNQFKVTSTSIPTDSNVDNDGPVFANAALLNVHPASNKVQLHPG